MVHAAIVRIDPTLALKQVLDLLRSGLPGSTFLERLYPYLHPDDLAGAVCAAAAVAGALVIVRRVKEPLRGAYLLTGRCVLSYVNLGAPSQAAEPYLWIRFVEYLPFFALLAWDGPGSRLVRRPIEW